MEEVVEEGRTLVEEEVEEQVPAIGWHPVPQ